MVLTHVLNRAAAWPLHIWHAIMRGVPVHAAEAERVRAWTEDLPSIQRVITERAAAWPDHGSKEAQARDWRYACLLHYARIF